HVASAQSFPAVDIDRPESSTPRLSPKLQTGASAHPGRRPAECEHASQAIWRNGSDARRYVRRTLCLTLMIYALMGLALSGILPAWCLLPVLPLLYVRVALALHELLHMRAAGQVPWFHRFATVFETPFSMGYREHRAIHLNHHRYAGTEN